MQETNQRHTEVYVQGHITPTANSPYLEFEVTTVALKDNRISKLKQKASYKPKMGHILQGKTYFLYPKRQFKTKYIILDKEENVMGIISKSSLFSGFWLFSKITEGLI